MKCRRKQKLITGEKSLNIPGLHYDGEKLICGLCGKHYTRLDMHIILTHGWTPDDYREEFSLNRTQPLITPQLSDKHRENTSKRKQQLLSHPFKLMNSCGKNNKGKPYRKQGLITVTILRNSPAMKIKQGENAKKAHILVPCTMCGQPTKGIVTNKRNFFCSDCAHKHENEYQTLWRKQHPEAVQLSQAKFRALHLQERRVKGREYSRIKYRLLHGIPLETPLNIAKSRKV